MIICGCGKEINDSGKLYNRVEQYKFDNYGHRVLIYAVCSHGTVIVDKRDGGITFNPNNLKAELNK